MEPKVRYKKAMEQKKNTNFQNGSHYVISARPTSGPRALSAASWLKRLQAASSGSRRALHPQSPPGVPGLPLPAWVGVPHCSAHVRAFRFPRLLLPEIRPIRFRLEGGASASLANGARGEG